MASLGRLLQIAGLILVPLGLIHYFSARDFVSEAQLMTWELGLLVVGALFFMVGDQLVKKS